MQPSGVVELTRATFPPVALMLIGVGSAVFGVGSGAPTAPPEASWISMYCQGAMNPDRGVIRLEGQGTHGA